MDFLLKSDFMELETNERKQKSGTHEPDVVSSNLTGPILKIKDTVAVLAEMGFH